MNVINIKDKAKLISGYWDPKIIGELNGQHVKLAKFKGEFPLHKHDNEDELFFVIQGEIKIEINGKIRSINKGEMIIAPKGIMHRPFAEDEALVMLFEPASTLNTGDIENELTRRDLEKI